MRYRIIATVSLLALANSVSARSQKSDVQTAPTKPPVVASRLPATPALPLMVVNKNPSCGCCKAWVERMRQAGFRVQVRDADNLDAVKTRVGIPAGKGSCHTAEIGGYFVEGHVPAADIKRLLAEKPAAKGLLVAGMPMGAPGMEMPDGSVRPYSVEIVGNDGQTQVYARYDK